MILQILFSIAAFIAISIVFLQKLNVWVATSAIFIVNGFYSVLQYTNISFTLYPSLLGAAGLLCIIHYSKRKKWMFGVCAGVIFILLFLFIMLRSC